MRVLRNYHLFTAIAGLTITSFTLPSISREGFAKISVSRDFYGDACTILLTKAALAFPA